MKAQEKTGLFDYTKYTSVSVVQQQEKFWSTFSKIDRYKSCKKLFFWFPYQDFW